MTTMTWPDDKKIIPYNPRDKTLSTIKALFYNVGFTTAFIYSVVSLVLEPLLRVQFEQRHQLSLYTLLRIRRVVNSAQKKLRTTPVSTLEFNKQDKSAERCIQTDDLFEKEVTFEAQTHWPDIESKINGAVWKLNHINQSIHSSSNDIASFSFQVKLLTDQMQLTDTSEKVIHKAKKVAVSIRQIKGWYVQGKIPK
ncbi:Pex17p NDAI_0F03670 [Naumovozyma dairenensis CBS 421]|uniref:Uncharacterized protein n=1 Tax=Naumovozyma dairenensis (strain ATCC 10597 / BCRC 20456 / CBS 421 / NBRC 0211 / NRRL Y-12639) TaxID=1071378 RepID=G0WD24_NAUDC|nr:hypothetical protein NDAI_0F03670 [Naumovozyma dairenensis CBS 421]CCD25685.1 hypothetical protein NDAI_0F03670 [Naumovozyma dairenensis CBS 421]